MFLKETVLPPGAGLCCHILSVCLTHKHSPFLSEKHLCVYCLFESHLFRSHLYDMHSGTEMPSHDTFKYNFNLAKLSLLPVNPDQLFLSSFCQCHLLDTPAQTDVKLMVMLVSRSVCPPLCSRLKYLSNCRMDCYEILHRHPL